MKFRPGDLIESMPHIKPESAFEVTFAGYVQGLEKPQYCFTRTGGSYFDCELIDMLYLLALRPKFQPVYGELKPFKKP